MIINIAILDDEKQYIDEIIRNIEDCDLSYEYVIDTFMNSKELLDSEKYYQIALVDVELGEEKDGFAVAREIREKNQNCIIIFVTSHDELARYGYKVDAFRFVYKDELEEELSEAIKSASDSIADKKLISFTVIKEKRQEIQENRKEVFIKDIIYIETEGRHLRIYLENESFLVNNNLKELLDELKDERFCIAHRSYIVNVKYAVGITSREIILESGINIPIGRAKKAEIESVYWSMKRRRRR